jgi:hypothetical protein
MSTLRQVVDDWYKRVTVTQRAHDLSAHAFGVRKYWLGIPALTLSALVGTAVFATVQKQPELWLQITAGFASVAAAILAVLQTFLGYPERAEKHRIAGAKYGALRRELEQLRASDSPLSDEVISRIRKSFDDLEIESPNNPQPILRAAGSASLEPAKSSPT